jgi:hypothetical protein
MPVDNERPPYVTFERRPIEDRNATIEAGRFIAKDVDFVIITRAGSRDTVEKPALEWLGEMEKKVQKGALPPEWTKHFQAAYEFWLKGESAPESGTPIKGWSVISPAMQETLLRAGIRTVEDLAMAGAGELITVGMGGQALKQKAQAWIDLAKDRGAVAEEMSALQTKVADLTELVTKLMEANRELKALVPKAEKAVI